LIFFRHFVELPAKINRYWTTFPTLAEIEREAKNDNSTLHVRLIANFIGMKRSSFLFGTPYITVLGYSVK